MESTEIVFVCNSTNNKNVRANELKVLEKYPDELYFVFGENNINIKKRHYKDLKTLNDDYNSLLKIKKDLENPSKKISKNKVTNSDIDSDIDSFRPRSSKNKLSE